MGGIRRVPNSELLYCYIYYTIEVAETNPHQESTWDGLAAAAASSSLDSFFSPIYLYFCDTKKETGHKNMGWE